MSDPATGIPDISLEPDPVIEAYKRDIDWTLVQQNLRKTPEERVLALMALIQLAEEAHKAGRDRSGQ